MTTLDQRWTEPPARTSALWWFLTTPITQRPLGGPTADLSPSASLHAVPCKRARRADVTPARCPRKRCRHHRRRQFKQPRATSRCCRQRAKSRALTASRTAAKTQQRCGSPVGAGAAFFAAGMMSHVATAACRTIPRPMIARALDFTRAVRSTLTRARCTCACRPASPRLRGW